MSTTNKIPAMLPTTPLPLNVVTGNVMYMYSCSQCDFKTHVESLFKQHVDSVHLGIPPSVVPAAHSVILGGAGHNTQTLVLAAPTATAAALACGSHPNDKLHKCPKCNILLPSKNQLTQHKRKVHGKTAMAAASSGTVTYSVVTTAPTTSSLMANLQPINVVAAMASAGVGNAAAAAASAGTVATNLTGKKTYSCTACAYSTTRRDGLSQHYDSVHLKIKNHQCELCPYAASQKGTLNRHVKLRHKKKEVLSSS